jgi:acyl-coenzyme A synthetase/AMP-(fatty) acid ligase
VAVSDAASGRVTTRGEFETKVATYAVALHAHGVRHGDRVAVLVEPGVDLIVVVYACWRIGAVTVVADRGLGLRGLGAAVRSARVRHVVGAGKARAATRVLRWASGAALVSLKSLQSAAVVARLADVQLAAPVGTDPAAVVFTSGATGPSKGVRYTFGQLCAQRDAVQAMYGITPNDRFVAAFAPFSVFGPALGIATGLADNPVTSPGTLTAAALNAACAQVGATLVFASPAALANVVRTASGPLPALAAVRLVMSAGAPVPIQTLQSMAQLCPQAALHTPYGMTEVLPVADISLAQRSAVGDGRGVCVGRPVPGCDVMVEPSGEVVVRAPWMSSGYDRLWRTQHLARPVVDGDVWHRTGDVGHLDANGNLWIEGRMVHLIHTVDGVVSPVPVEVTAERVDGVRRAAAVGIGPVGVQQVVVVVEDGASRGGPASSALTAAVRASCAPLAIAAVWAVRALPVDMRHNAKIDRTALAARMSSVLSGGASGGRP